MGYLTVTGNCKKKAFTLIELMVTLTILSLLLTLVAPRYFKSVDKARDEVLVHQLSGLRQAIEQYYNDKGSYPETLDALIKERYLRQIPVDPVTERVDTWILVPAPPGKTGIADIHSGAPGKHRSGQLYSTL
jgi:general secretion pathway protein G